MEIDALKFTVLFSSTFVYGDKISRQNSKNKLCFEISQKNNDDSKTVQEENWSIVDKQSVLKSAAAESSVTELTNYTYTVEPAGRRLGPLLFPAVLAKLGWLKFWRLISNTKLEKRGRSLALFGPRPLKKTCSRSTVVAHHHYLHYWKVGYKTEKITQ